MQQRDKLHAVDILGRHRPAAEGWRPDADPVPGSWGQLGLGPPCRVIEKSRDHLRPASVSSALDSPWTITLIEDPGEWQTASSPWGGLHHFWTQRSSFGPFKIVRDSNSPHLPQSRKCAGCGKLGWATLLATLQNASRRWPRGRFAMADGTGAVSGSFQRGTDSVHSHEADAFGGALKSTLRARHLAVQVWHGHYRLFERHHQISPSRRAKLGNAGRPAIRNRLKDHGCKHRYRPSRFRDAL